MIKLKHISKTYNNYKIIKDINYEFPKTGLISVCGESGCGKTTLLNILASLIDYDGEMTYNGCDLKLNELNTDLIRNKYIGFIFQDFKLFEFETVKQNLMLALDIKINDNMKVKEKRICDLLTIVNLQEKEDEFVKNLSGGEKQRISIARAICNSPKIILADEPTGNLDSENSKEVMDLLLRISKNSLVVLVSHDEELVKKYADKILTMKDGKIVEEIENKHKKEVIKFPLIKINKNNKTGNLPIKFAFAHALNSIKVRKWRTFLVLITTSLGLLGVGLGSVIRSIISTNMYKSYSSIINTDKVIVSPLDTTNKKETIRALPLETVDEIMEDYGGMVTHQGTFYQNNFVTMFDAYRIYLDLPGTIKLLPSYNIQFFNDYFLLSEFNKKINYCKIDELENDDVVLGVTAGMLNEICYQLHIPRTIENFIDYLKNNDLKINFDVSKKAWSYDVSFSLNVVGFAMTDFDCFMHDSFEWNEYIFEECMHLTNTDLINVNSERPWDLKKVKYISFFNERDSFIRLMKDNQKYENVVSEILDVDYYPILYQKTEAKDCNRIGLYLIENISPIPYWYSKYFKEVSNNVRDVIPGSEATYVMYPKNLMMGFSKNTFISNDTNYLENIIDLTSYIKESDNNIMNVPNQVLMGHFSKSGGLIFNSNYVLEKGERPKNYQEIVISKAIANKFNINALNKSIYLCFPIEESILPNGYLKRNYRMVDLKVVGISQSNKFELNHDFDWTIMFFETQLGVSAFTTKINSFCLTVDEAKIDETINILQKAFPQFETSSPISGVKSSVEDICDYIEKILLVASISSVIISVILLLICSYLHLNESKKDIGLARCLGVSKNQSQKLIFSYSLLISVLSFIFASIELLTICVVLSKTFAETLMVEATLIFNPIALVYMAILSFGIGIISSILIAIKVNKLNPIECLQS